MTTEGGFVHLDGVVLPIGARGLVSLERATAAAFGAARRAAGLPEARLHAFHGAVRFGKTGEPSFVADVAFHGEPHPDEAAWIAGELVIERASWTPAPGEVEARAMSGKAKLFVTSHEWRLDDGVLEGERARVRFSGRGALDGSAAGGGVAHASLVLEQAKVGPFLDAASAIVGRAIGVPPGVPVDAGITGDLVYDADRGGRAELHIEAEGLDMKVRGEVGSDGRGLDAHVDARIRPAVPMRKAGLSPKLLPRDEDTLVLDLHVTGDTSKPMVKGIVRGEEIVFRAGRPRFAPPAAVVRELVAELAAEGDQALARATARAGEGTLTLHLDVPVREPRRTRAHAWIKDLDAPWVSALLSGAGARIVLPRDARGSIELVVTRDDANGKASIVTPRSRIAIDPITVRGRTLDGTRLAGDLALADALTLGLDRLSVRPTPEGVVTIDTAIEGSFDAPVARGVLASPRLSLAIASRDDVAPWDLLDARASATLSREALVVRDLVFRAYDASLGGEARIPLSGDERSSAAFRGEGGPSFVAAAARASKRHVALDDSARVSGEVRLGGEASVAADVTLATHASRGTALAVRFVLGRDGLVDGTTVRGHVGLADALFAHPLDGAVAIAPEGAAYVDAIAKGPAGEPVVAGFVAADVLRLTVDGGAAGPFVLTDASGLFRVDAQKIVWHKVEARAHAGTLASAGFAARHGRDLVAKIAVRDLAIETIPLAGEEGTRTLEELACGRLSSTIRIERRDGALGGKGKLALDEAVFPVLLRARAPLAKYGLPALPARADAPATAELALDGASVSLRAMHASVPGCVARGDVTVASGGLLSGALTVTLDDAYLRKSAMLVLPSVLAEKLTLPVTIGGSVRAPDIDADLAACFGRFVTENRVSAFVSDAVEEVAHLFGKRPSARPSAPPPEPVADEDRLLVAELEAARPDWRDLEQRLEERRVTSRRVRVRVPS